MKKQRRVASLPLCWLRAFNEEQVDVGPSVRGAGFFSYVTWVFTNRDLVGKHISDMGLGDAQAFRTYVRYQRVNQRLNGQFEEAMAALARRRGTPINDPEEALEIAYAARHLGKMVGEVVDLMARKDAIERQRRERQRRERQRTPQRGVQTGSRAADGGAERTETLSLPSEEEIELKVMTRLVSEIDPNLPPAALKRLHETIGHLDPAIKRRLYDGSPSEEEWLARYHTAEDGARRTIQISEPVVVQKRPRVEKRDVTFMGEGRFAKGRVVSFDPKEVDINLVYHEAARMQDYYVAPKPRMGLSVRGYVELVKDTRPLVASNGLQGDLYNPTSFIIAEGKLIHKEGARGVHQERYEPMNGDYSVFVLGPDPRVAKVRIENNELKTKNILFAFQGPPLLIDGRDVTDQIRQQQIIPEGEGLKRLPQRNDEVSWHPTQDTAAFSAIGVMRDGRMVLLSMKGDPDQEGELLVKDLAQILLKLEVKDSLALGGSGDVQQYLEGDREEWIVAKQRRGSETPLEPLQETRPVGSAILVYPRSAQSGSVEVRKVEDVSKDGGSQIRVPRPLLDPLNQLEMELKELLSGV